MRISDWSSDLCSSDLDLVNVAGPQALRVEIAGEEIAPSLDIGTGPAIVRRPGSRSRGEVHPGDVDGIAGELPSPGRSRVDCAEIVGLLGERQPAKIGQRPELRRMETGRVEKDRKSTRLNSRH